MVYYVTLYITLVYGFCIVLSHILLNHPLIIFVFLQ
jgi:hypothetical protein